MGYSRGPSNANLDLDLSRMTQERKSKSSQLSDLIASINKKRVSGDDLALNNTSPGAHENFQRPRPLASTFSRSHHSLDRAGTLMSTNHSPSQKTSSALSLLLNKVSSMKNPDLTHSAPNY